MHNAETREIIAQKLIDIRSIIHDTLFVVLYKLNLF
uniref:Uncharacterized protein n=1 Tax=Arundo donax TaxID=35708 RepID=A0A0A9FFB1_ARUDO